ncbi:MAG: hypothetical protein M3032_03185 [Verrucomicrobiota bacterium]|nr:hypothetical protein [Verrucomicrobiota bacterium]
MAMTAKLKGWLALALVVVFLAGGALGVLGGALHARNIVVHGRGGFGPERMRQHLRRQLQLTDEQAAKIDPVIDRTAARIDAIRRETADRVAETMNESHREIAPLLTPEQQERLEQMRRRHMEMMQRHEHVPGGHGGPR